jgi:hypothetical protein
MGEGGRGIETIGKKLRLTTSPIENPTCQSETQTAKNYIKMPQGLRRYRVDSVHDRAIL